MKICNDCKFADADYHFEHERIVDDESNETDYRVYCPVCNSENISDVNVMGNIQITHVSILPDGSYGIGYINKAE